MIKKLIVILLLLVFVAGNFIINSADNAPVPAVLAAKSEEAPLPAVAPEVVETPEETPVPEAEATAVPTAAAAPTPEPEPTATPAPTPTPVPLTEEEQLGQDIANFALSFWGSKYKYGGEDPETGFDCSGLIFYVYGQFGYKLERVSAAQAMQGVEVPKEEIRPGDVLCFFYPGQKVSHMGLYVGHGCYIHARGQSYGVVVSPINHPERDRDYIVKRYIGCEELMLPKGAPPPTA